MGTMGILQLNHLHPPFNNVKARQAMLYLINNADYLNTIAADKKLQTLCFSYFGCGVEMETDAGSEIYKGAKDVKKAEALFKEAGYNGEPITILHATDHQYINPANLVMIQQLRKAGFLKLDVQAMDWGTVVSRRAKKEPPAQGGWNIFITGTTVLTSSSPVTHTSIGMGCDKAWFGWPCDAKFEAAAQGVGLRARHRDAQEDRGRAIEARLRAGAVHLVRPVAQPGRLPLGPDLRRHLGALGPADVEHREEVTNRTAGTARRAHLARARAGPADRSIPVTAYILRRLLATIPVMIVVALFVFSAAPSDAGRSGGRHRGRRRVAGRDRGHPPQARSRPAGVGTVRRLYLEPAARRSRHLDLLQPAGDDAGEAAARADRSYSRSRPSSSPSPSRSRWASFAAWKADTIVDRVVMGFSVLGFAVPVFLVGYLLIYVFAIQLRWLPVQGYRPLAEGIVGTLRSIALPAFALGMAYMALIARITRASMLEVLSEDYIRTAHAKGVATRSVLLRHALKNAAVPIVTVIGIGLALLISGVVITETVFNIPGLGRLTVDAILKRDYPIIQGLIILFAGAKVLVNLLIDISYTFFDPRIRQ